MPFFLLTTWPDAENFPLCSTSYAQRRSLLLDEDSMDAKRRHLHTLTLTLLLAAATDASAQMTSRFAASLAVAEPETGALVAPAMAVSAAYPSTLYAGRDERGVPRYIERRFTDEERRLLREQFGIEEPGRLYLSDTLPSAS